MSENDFIHVSSSKQAQTHMYIAEANAVYSICNFCSLLLSTVGVFRDKMHLSFSLLRSVIMYMCGCYSASYCSPDAFLLLVV